MAAFNKVVLVGNLTRDPESKYTQDGKSIAVFGLAVNSHSKSTKQDVMFIDVTCFDRCADFVTQYLQKGSSVLVDGRLRLESWEDKNGGGKRSKHSITASVVESLGGRNENANGGRDAEREESPF